MSSRVAVVTDTLHFIGASSASALAHAGYTVLCHDDDFADPAERAAFEARHPDLKAAKAQDAAPLITEAVERYGRLDTLVNNDAYPAHHAPIAEAKPDDLREALDRLIVRAFERCCHAVPHMRAQGGGKILFVTSAAPLRGLPNYAIYVTARGGANALAQTLAQELARDNIQVNAIAPNFVESPTYFPPSLMENPETREKILRRIPLGRLGKQEEAAALVAFLASPEADFITGHVVPLAGGWA